jgi:hypothetical protein
MIFLTRWMHDEGWVTKIGALSALFNWANKLESICKAINRIKQFSDSLSASSSHANFLTFYQARFDYWMVTNNLVSSGPLALKCHILNKTAGFWHLRTTSRGHTPCQFHWRTSSSQAEKILSGYPFVQASLPTSMSCHKRSIDWIRMGTWSRECGTPSRVF